MDWNNFRTEISKYLLLQNQLQAGLVSGEWNVNVGAAINPLAEQLVAVEMDCKKLIVEEANNLVMLMDNMDVYCVYYFCLWSKRAVTCSISTAEVIPLFRVTFGSNVAEQGSIYNVIADSSNSFSVQNINPVGIDRPRLVERVNEILQECDWSIATKKSIRDQLSAEFGVNLDSDKKFLNEHIRSVVKQRNDDSENDNDGLEHDDAGYQEEIGEDEEEDGAGFEQEDDAKDLDGDDVQLKVSNGLEQEENDAGSEGQKDAGSEEGQDDNDAGSEGQKDAGSEEGQDDDDAGLDAASEEEGQDDDDAGSDAASEEEEEDDSGSEEEEDDSGSEEEEEEDDSGSDGDNDGDNFNEDEAGEDDEEDSGEDEANEDDPGVVINEGEDEEAEDNDHDQVEDDDEDQTDSSDDPGEVID